MQVEPHNDPRRHVFGRQALTFYMVGGLAALAYVFVTGFLIGLGTGIADWLVSGGTYAVFMPAVYVAHRVFSFRSDAPHGRAFSRYVAVQGLGLMLATALSFAVFEVFGLGPLVGSAIVIGLASFFNYLMLRGWAFAAPVSG